MCVDCVLTSLRIAQVDPGDRPPSEVVLSQKGIPRMEMVHYQDVTLELSARLLAAQREI
jgi:hypothetical protein